MEHSSSLCSSLLSRLCRYASHARIFASNISFEAELADKLTHYSKALDLVSLMWICKAMDVVLFTQKQTVTRPVVMTTRSDDATAIQGYMEDSVRLLDACCLLKESLAGAQAYVKASLGALHRLQGLKLLHEAEIQRAKQAVLGALRAKDRMMHQKEGAKGVQKNWKSPAHRLQALTSMLGRMSKRLPGRPASPPSRLALQAQLNIHILRTKQKATPQCSTLLPELHTMDASLHHIFETLLHRPAPFSEHDRENLSIAVSTTTALVNEVGSCIGRLLHQLDGISSCIADTRIALLSSYHF